MELVWYLVDDDYYNAYCKEMFRLVNEVREDAGVGKLVLDNTLVNLSKERTIELKDDFSHNSKVFAIGTYGENIHESGRMYTLNGYTTTAPENLAAEIFNSWMSSEGHRENILSSTYKKFGTYWSIDGYAVQLFI